MFGKNAGNFQYSVRPCQHWGNWKRGNGKRETVEKWHRKTRNRHALLNSTFNKNMWHILPVPLSLKLLIRHFATNVVILQFKIMIILITTFHSVRVTNKPQSVSNAAYNFPSTHCSYSATGIRNWATQQTWLNCFFVSLAVQRLPKFLFPHFQCRVFYCRATSASLQHSTLHLYEPPETHYDCEIVHSMHIHS